MSSYDDIPEAEHLILSFDDDITPVHRSQSSRKRPLDFVPRLSVNTSGLLLILFANIVVSVLIVWLSGSVLSSTRDEPWEYYSPILKHVKLPFHTKKIDARLFPDASDPLAVFAAPPSPEVDHAWNKISRNMIVGLTRADLLLLGKDPTTAVKYNPQWNISNSEDTYLGVLDVFHQVHCLNMLRQNLIMNYDYYYADAYGYEPEVFHKKHLTHCVSMLLQNIMCHADASVYTHVWREGNPVPWADFGINRQCRDFDALMRFRDTHDVEGSFDKFRFYTDIPEEAVVLPMEAGMAEMLASADEYKDGKYYKKLDIKGCST
ncbi:hypothetical protein SPI_08035 [Niveomyces insectorum RCEF 264]|uniref:Tat pathway signal sequence n=1 Tax=Niveomyces insectorum RCEF 264 TaxID=1081102 RepID=A0A167NR91_9HYPO|nr:hypothetical protein SPI_08035 [Niveomyces insectorum RCEF 264]